MQRVSDEKLTPISIICLESFDILFIVDIGNKRVIIFVNQDHHLFACLFMSCLYNGLEACCVGSCYVCDFIFILHFSEDFLKLRIKKSGLFVGVSIQIETQLQDKIPSSNLWRQCIDH